MNIGSLIEDNVKRFGKREMTHFEGKWYTNAEVNRDANRMGNALKALGIGRGDRVAVQMFNSPLVLSAFPAIFKIGAIVVPLVPLLRPEQSSYICRDCGAKAVLTSSDLLERVQEAQRGAPDLEHIILADSDEVPGTIPYQKLMSESADELLIEDTDNDDVAALVYTAGTTGRPKGVMHTHYSSYSLCMGVFEVLLNSAPVTLRQASRAVDPKTLQIVEVVQEVTGVSQDAVRLSALPLSHVYGIVFMNVGYLMGEKSVLLRLWNVEEALKTIEAFRITHMEGVPAMYIQMLNFPDLDKYDLSSLRRCGSGGAPVPVELGQRWKQRMGIDLWEGWGMTESGGVTSGQAGDCPARYGTIGKCLPKCVTMKVFDDNGGELPAGERGEIVVKGPTVMKGYWNLPEETAEAIKGGWLYTGDVGYVDQDGYFYITDRKKDIIIRGGENVSPKEVEEVLYQHPKVAEAGVIGIPDDMYGEEIRAFVALKAGEQAGQDEIIAFCKQRLPTFKTPKTVQFMAELPKSSVGKMLKTELRKLG